MSASAAASFGALRRRRVPGQLAVLDDLRGRTHRDRIVRDVALDHRVRAEHAAPADGGVAQDGHLGRDPGVGADAHRALENALVLDRQVDVVHPVVEVADVDPVGHQHRIAQFDVDVGVDDVVAAQHHLVPEAQRTLVAADGVLVADVHPATDLHRRQFGGGLNLHALAEEDHAPCDDVRVGQLELQQPPVPHQVPRAVGAIGDHPSQRCHREEIGLARVAEPRTAPTLVQRRSPHRRHGRKAYASASGPQRLPSRGLTNRNGGRTECSGDSSRLRQQR